VIETIEVMSISHESEASDARRRDRA